MGDATPIDNVTGATVVNPQRGESQDTKPESQEEEVSDQATEDTEVVETSKEEAPAEDKPETEESFTKSFDPKKLSPELQEAYKQMQADYTKKTQEIAKVRKAAEAYDRFRPYLQKVFSDEGLRNQVFGAKKQEEPAEIEYPDDPKEFAKAIKAEALAEFRKESEISERRRLLEENHARDIADAEKVDKRLTEDLEFAAKIAGIVNLDPEYNSRNISAVEATKKAIKEFDSYVAKLVEAKNNELLKKAKSASSGVYTNTSPANTLNVGKKMSIHESFLEAEKELATK